MDDDFTFDEQLINSLLDDDDHENISSNSLNFLAQYMPSPIVAAE